MFHKVKVHIPSEQPKRAGNSQEDDFTVPRYKNIMEEVNHERNELHSIIKELKEYKNLKEEAEARISELEATIKAHMTEQDTDTLIVDEFKCKLTTVSTNRLDNKALQAECPDIQPICQSFIISAFYRCIRTAPYIIPPQK